MIDGGGTPQGDTDAEEGNDFLHPSQGDDFLHATQVDFLQPIEDGYDYLQPIDGEEFLHPMAAEPFLDSEEDCLLQPTEGEEDLLQPMVGEEDLLQPSGGGEEQCKEFAKQPEESKCSSREHLDGEEDKAKLKTCEDEPHSPNDIQEYSNLIQEFQNTPATSTGGFTVDNISEPKEKQEGGYVAEDTDSPTDRPKQLNKQPHGVSEQYTANRGGRAQQRGEYQRHTGKKGREYRGADYHHRRPPHPNAEAVLIIAKELIDPCLRPKYRTCNNVRPQFDSISFNLASKLIYALGFRRQEKPWSVVALKQNISVNLGLLTGAIPAARAAYKLVELAGARMEHLDPYLPGAKVAYSGPYEQGWQGMESDFNSGPNWEWDQQNMYQSRHRYPSAPPHWQSNGTQLQSQYELQQELYRMQQQEQQYLQGTERVSADPGPYVDSAHQFPQQGHLQTERTNQLSLAYQNHLSANGIRTDFYQGDYQGDHHASSSLAAGNRESKSSSAQPSSGGSRTEVTKARPPPSYAAALRDPAKPPGDSRRPPPAYVDALQDPAEPPKHPRALVRQRSHSTSTESSRSTVSTRQGGSNTPSPSGRYRSISRDSPGRKRARRDSGHSRDDSSGKRQRRYPRGYSPSPVRPSTRYPHSKYSRDRSWTPYSREHSCSRNRPSITSSNRTPPRRSNVTSGKRSPPRHSNVNGGGNHHSRDRSWSRNRPSGASSNRTPPRRSDVPSRMRSPPGHSNTNGGANVSRGGRQDKEEWKGQRKKRRNRRKKGPNPANTEASREQPYHHRSQEKGHDDSKGKKDDSKGTKDRDQSPVVRHTNADLKSRDPPAYQPPTAPPSFEKAMAAKVVDSKTRSEEKRQSPSFKDALNDEVMPASFQNKKRAADPKPDSSSNKRQRTKDETNKPVKPPSSPVTSSVPSPSCPPSSTSSTSPPLKAPSTLEYSATANILGITTAFPTSSLEKLLTPLGLGTTCVLDRKMDNQAQLQAVDDATLAKIKHKLHNMDTLGHKLKIQIKKKES